MYTHYNTVCFYVVLCTQTEIGHTLRHILGGGGEIGGGPLYLNTHNLHKQMQTYTHTYYMHTYIHTHIHTHEHELRGSVAKMCVHVPCVCS